MINFLMWVSLFFISINSPHSLSNSDSPGAENSKICFRSAIRSASYSGRVSKNFIHNAKYTYEIPVTSVKDQCALGGCWLYGTLGHLESIYLKKTGKPIEFSVEYLQYHYYLTQAMHGINSVDKISIEQGGFSTTAMSLIKKFGLVPTHEWKPAVDIKKPEHSERLTYFLTNILAHFHESASRSKDEESKIKLIENTVENVFKLLEDYFGEIPKTITNKAGKKISPQKYAEELFEHEVFNLIDAYPIGSIKKGNLTEGIEAMRSLSFIKNKITQRLKDGFSVPAIFYWNNIFIDQTTGIASIKAFEVPEYLQISIPRFRTSHSFNSENEHLVLIVGIELDSNGKPLKYKIKNSHGIHSGDQGYYHIYADFFDKYFLSATLPKSFME